MSQSRVQAFDLGDFRGEISSVVGARDPEASIVALTQPAATSETLHWGRNYLYSGWLATGDGPLEVVIKQFRNQGVKRRLERRLKGSKAERSWRGAWAMVDAAVPTAEPILWVESTRANGPSYFITRRLHDVLEARYFFRALESGREAEEYPELDPELVMDGLGRTIRRMHDAGIWHRDLSIGNVLLRPGGEHDRPLEIFIIDLNRMRSERRLTTLQRTRDLSRLRVFRPAHQERLLRAYWGAEPQDLGYRKFLYRLTFQGFLAKVATKKTLRAPFRSLRDWVLPRHPHAHIPQAPAGTSSRDRVVWDGLSDQPHQHATRVQRLAVRLADAPLHAREWATALGTVPKVRRRYLELKSRLYSQPIDWQGMGIAVRPWPENPEALLEAVLALGCRRVLLRLHPWQDDHRNEETLAAELHSLGLELAFVLAQNRDLVRDSGRWRAAVSELGERFGRFGCHFQIGQAINRSKWGIWNHREYFDLARVACEVLRTSPGRQLMGPGVIDYEPLRTAGILNLPQEGVRFDILASLLYVDRRGAPENRQLGFDTVDKVVQMKAIAETAVHCGDRSWITEVNWPLWEGPHSPAGRKVSVDETTQANYLVRYYLQALGTGLVERVYWWQLVARGYGLAHDAGDSSLRRRPGFAAFSTLCRNLEGLQFRGPVAVPPPARLYQFRDHDGTDLFVAWSGDNSPCSLPLAREILRAQDRDGRELELADAKGVEVDGSPRYLWLASG